MKLKIKLLDWSAGFPVAMLNQRTADKMGVNTGDRISIKTSSTHPHEVSTVTNTTSRLVKKGDVGISSELKKQLGLRVNQKVEVGLAPLPKSLAFIKKKLDGKQLSQKEINEIISDVVNNSLYESEIALFISAMYKQGMRWKETIYLIKAISKSGHKLDLKDKSIPSRLIVDKHGIGGIPGNRTTPIIVSICAAAGLVIPKSSSRAITSAAGTADVIETFAHVEFSMRDLKKIVKITRGCMVWGGALGMVPADSKIIRVEKMLKIDPESQLLASIMSKKLAVGSKHIVIDIPYGKTAKVDKKGAIRLKKKFEYLGKYFRKNIRVVLTKAEGPRGDYVGPALELIDIINILNPKKKGPKDLEDKSLLLAGQLLEMTKKAKKGKGEEMARSILMSGDAFRKFKQIIEVQGGRIKKIVPGRFKKEILAKKSGKIREMDNKKINSLARIAGCPADKRAGLHIPFNPRDSVKKGDRILTIYAESKSRLDEAVKFCNKEKPIKIK